MALIALLLGPAARGRLATRMTSRPLHYWTCSAFCIDGFLLIGAGLVSLALRTPVDDEYVPLLRVIGLTTLAMGFMNATTRMLGIPDLTTTVLTQTITGLAADSSLAGGTNPRWRRRVASVLLMFAGATVGGVILRCSVAAALCLCGIASVACALAAFERFPHPRGGDSRGVPSVPESSKIQNSLCGGNYESNAHFFCSWSHGRRSIRASTREECCAAARGVSPIIGYGRSDLLVPGNLFQILLTNPRHYANPSSGADSTFLGEVEFDNRTSLITDPPNGRLPEYTPAGERRRSIRANAGKLPRDNVKEFMPSERCISFTVPRVGTNYSRGLGYGYYQIVQTSDSVLFFMEVAHEARIIPLDGRICPL
jgi:uncharacterized membrane protein YoaK (UPF0700 family)